MPARPLPARSVAAAVIRAVNRSLLANGIVLGVNVAVCEAAPYVTVPGTVVPSVVLVTRKVVALTDDAAIASLNAAVMRVLVGTLDAAFAGNVTETVGRVTSDDAAVLNDHVNGAASAMPLVSVAAVEIVAWHAVLAGSADAGVSVAVMLAAS